MLELRFRDHAEFHGQVVRATAAGAAVGAVLAGVAGLSGQPPGAAVFAALGAAALAWGLAPPRSGRGWLAALGAVGLATLVGLLAARRDPALGAALAGAALAIYTGAGLDRPWRLTAAVALALAVPLGVHVARALVE